jgi:uncharacterized protein YycO
MNNVRIGGPIVISPGDFGLVPMAGNVGALIKLGLWLNGDPYGYQHAFVYVGNDQIVEAELGGAKLSPLSEYASESIAWYHCPPERGQAITDVAMGYIGTPYSFMDYAALAALRFHLPIATLLRNYVATSKHMICSQYVDKCYQDVAEEFNDPRLRLFQDGRKPGDVTPGDLYTLILAQEASM